MGSKTIHRLFQNLNRVIEIIMYNGGRWHLNLLKGSVNPDKYQDACSVEDFDLNNFISTEAYFECPLLSKRGGN